MYRLPFSFCFPAKTTFGIAILFLAQFAAAQLEPALPPIADPRDKRFVGVMEDWNSPSLKSDSLTPTQPLVFDASTNPAYSVELIQVQWRWGDPIDLYVMKPKGVKKPPVILYLYSYPSETDIYKNEAWQQAALKDGFAAVGFLTALTGHRYHDRPMKEWFISDLQECLATSAHDVQMVLNYLENRGDLDMNRVGMVAEGSGASVGILASAVDPRIKAFDALDPWGDWPTWMADSPFVPKEERADYVRPEYLKKLAILEPINWLAKIQARKFRLQDAIFDSETPDAARTKLRAAVPPGSTVVLYKTPDEYKAAITENKQMDWIREQLRALPDPAPPTAMAAKKNIPESPPASSHP